MTLVFGTEGINLAIADDGTGLPAEFDERGEVTNSMLDSAAQMGDRLRVSSGLSDLGATATCWVPHVLELGGQKLRDNHVVRVLLVDDHQIMLDGLQKLIESSGDFEIVGQAQTGDQAVSLAIEHKPDVVVMDVLLTGRDGIDACREIKETVPDTRVLMLTAATEEESVLNAISAGATGYLRKLSNAQKLLDTIRDVSEGEYRMPQEVMRKVFAGIRTSPQLADKSALDRLTEREKQILQLFAGGRSYTDIARQRGNQTVTIRNAIYGIQNKIGVKSKQEMVLWALRNGLLNDDPNDVIPS